jgi:hypothetical protein
LVAMTNRSQQPVKALELPVGALVRLILLTAWQRHREGAEEASRRSKFGGARLPKDPTFHQGESTAIVCLDRLRRDAPSRGPAIDHGSTRFST